MIVLVSALWLVERLATAGTGWPTLDPLLDWSPLAIVAIGLASALKAFLRLQGQVSLAKLQNAPQERGR